MLRAYYRNNTPDFVNDNNEAILGTLTQNHHFNLEINQTNAWIGQIQNLKEQLQGINTGEVFFEYSIPRMGKRVDVVLLVGDVVFVLEYKVGANHYDAYALDQALDYSLDLKNFHEGSHSKYIVPILIATQAEPYENSLSWFGDKVAVPLRSNGDDLRDIIGTVLSDVNQVNVSSVSEGWAQSGYKPTPTIVEAAQALYQGHSVEEISRSDAGAKNLSHTADCINEIIHHSKINKRKSICFVTGVPGAGKTLAGLNISTQTFDNDTEEHAVFLSGNGPLVMVLREALARDEVARSILQENRITKKAATQKVSAFIQNIHHFRDEGIRDPDAPPIEHVVIFDEAQRAWNQAKTESFMNEKKGISSFGMSEPEFLISYMDRKDDWCTIICLIGGGQEINSGEAGLTEWFDALKKSFNHWDVYHSGQLENKDYSWNRSVDELVGELNAREKPDLHLAVSVRSFRAEHVSSFVGGVIDGDAEKARQTIQFLNNYEIVLTRNLSEAKEWLREHSRGTERHGIVASSGGIRLKPEGINVKNKLDPATWFLNDKRDVRSSYYLEDVATEFDIQGLELDWTCVCWDADFRRENNNWGLYSFKGSKWQNVNDSFRQTYLANAYRVLLTRARQGMVIFVPKGDERDYTRPPEYYDETFQFLKDCGLQTL